MADRVAVAVRVERATSRRTRTRVGVAVAVAVNGGGTEEVGVAVGVPPFSNSRFRSVWRSAQTPLAWTIRAAMQMDRHAVVSRSRVMRTLSGIVLCALLQNLVARIIFLFGKN